MPATIRKSFAAAFTYCGSTWRLLTSEYPSAPSKVAGQMQFSRRTLPVPCFPHGVHEVMFLRTRGCEITLRSTMLSSDDEQTPPLSRPAKLRLSPFPYSTLRAM